MIRHKNSVGSPPYKGNTFGTYPNSRLRHPQHVGVLYRMLNKKTLLPRLPSVPSRPPRPVHRQRSHSGFSASRPLSPVSEVPPPSEVLTLHLETDVLHQQLAAMKRQSEEMDRQLAALKKENHHYRQQIDRQNHLVAQIANTLELVFAEYRVAAEQYQIGQPRTGEQMAEHEHGWI
ncbi:hypothetical protein GE09DRAFT_1149326 [Coniochaeta sp. 2T2.1]|nr:hypothetical protein GE09DRAFT_1149326 [Coniochaeta sp. 2T2.1]